MHSCLMLPTKQSLHIHLSGMFCVQIGKTRVFLRAGQLAQLEGARGRRLTSSALIIQAAFR